MELTKVYFFILTVLTNVSGFSSSAVLFCISNSASSSSPA